MDKDKLTLYLFGISYAILLGSFVYIFPMYKGLWLFLEVITLPAIYMIGYEILMDKQKKKIINLISNLEEDFEQQRSRKIEKHI